MAGNERGCVYFIQSGDGGPVKIGWTGGPPQRRLKTLEIGSPHPLKGLGVVRGGLSLEAKLHEWLEDDRLRGEWFKPSGQITAYLEAFGEPWQARRPTGSSQRRYLHLAAVAPGDESYPADPQCFECGPTGRTETLHLFMRYDFDERFLCDACDVRLLAEEAARKSVSMHVR